MFDASIDILKSFVSVLPLYIPFILVINIISHLLWGDR